VGSRVGKETFIGCVVAVRRVVGDDIRRVCGNSNGRGETCLLPARRGLVCEGDTGELRTGAGPQIAGMRAGIARSLVKQHSGDIACYIRAKLETYFNGRTVRSRGRPRSGRTVPDGTRTSRAAGDCVAGTGRGSLQIRAIVGGAHQHGRGAGERGWRPSAVSPLLASGRGLPGTPPID